MTISAQIIADSINQNGSRLTTFVATFPRIILAEINTHRAFSRNSASSRAIPFNRMLAMVQDHPFIPMKWMKDHKGMQGTEYFTYEESRSMEVNWLKARNEAVDYACKLNDLGVTKQVVNRLLEPFMYHTAIITSSEWENFFALRAHEAAEIHLQCLAGMMLEQYNESQPKLLQPGEWHLPFGDKLDEARIEQMVGGLAQHPEAMCKYKALKLKIAVARCARVSYMNFEGRDDYAADGKLHDMLLQQGHMSPFEHVAKAACPIEDYQHGNFGFGWCQYRKMMVGENKKDERVIKKEVNRG